MKQSGAYGNNKIVSLMMVTIELGQKQKGRAPFVLSETESGIMILTPPSPSRARGWGVEFLPPFVSHVTNFCTSRLRSQNWNPNKKGMQMNSTHRRTWHDKTQIEIAIFFY